MEAIIAVFLTVSLYRYIQIFFFSYTTLLFVCLYMVLDYFHHHHQFTFVGFAYVVLPTVLAPFFQSEQISSSASMSFSGSPTIIIVLKVCTVLNQLIFGFPNVFLQIPHILIVLLLLKLHLIFGGAQTRSVYVCWWFSFGVYIIYVDPSNLKNFWFFDIS